MNGTELQAGQTVRVRGHQGLGKVQFVFLESRLIRVRWPEGQTLLIDARSIEIVTPEEPDMTEIRQHLRNLMIKTTVDTFHFWWGGWAGDLHYVPLQHGPFLTESEALRACWKHLYGNFPTERTS